MIEVSQIALKKTIIAIIPARGGSKRLSYKNIFPIAGKPMLFWAVQACKQSKYVDAVYISTDDARIADVAHECGAEVIDRPPELGQDHVRKQDAICHAYRVLLARGVRPDVVISVQPNSPELDERQLDSAIETFFRFDRKEIFSVDSNLMQNAAFRIMTNDVVCLDSLSIHAGVFIAECEDVHTEEDVRRIERSGRLQQRLEVWGRGK